MHEIMILTKWRKKIVTYRQLVENSHYDVLDTLAVQPCVKLSSVLDSEHFLDGFVKYDG